jgi:hypothetical protein
VALPPLSRDDIIKAMARFDELRATDYANWQNEYDHVIKANNTLYPVKPIAALATGLNTAKFKSQEARRKIQPRGFELDRLSNLQVREDREWSLRPGDSVKRKDLHDQFGGNRQSGIAYPKEAGNILIYSSPAGEEFGYSDGWQNDGMFHYTGEGQVGDQTMTNGNLALLRHRPLGHAVRVFSGSRGEVSYVGRFVLPEADPVYEADAPDKNGDIRMTYVFRMQPLGDAVRALLPEASEPWIPPDAPPLVEAVPIEKANTFVTAESEAQAPRSAERVEARLVQEFVKAAGSLGLTEATRLRIKPPGQTVSLFSDVWFEANGLLVEAKGTVSREAIRMAVGQLLDYARFAPSGTSLAILVPERPREDLCDLAASLSIGIIFPSSKGQFQMEGVNVAGHHH